MTGYLRSVTTDDTYIDGAGGVTALTATIEVSGSNWEMTVEKVDPRSITMPVGSEITLAERDGRMVVA